MQESLTPSIRRLRKAIPTVLPGQGKIQTHLGKIWQCLYFENSVIALQRVPGPKEASNRQFAVSTITAGMADWSLVCDRNLKSCHRILCMGISKYNPLEKATVLLFPVPSCN